MEYFYKLRQLIAGGDLTTLNKLSSSNDKSDLFQAQSLRKQYYPIAADDINTDTTNLFWWNVIGFTSGVIMAAIAFWYFGYFDYSGRPDDGSGYDFDITGGPRYIPLPALPETPLMEWGDIKLDPSGSTSINKVSDIGNYDTSSSGSLTPTARSNWGLPTSMREQFNTYWKEPTSTLPIETSPLERKIKLDNEELATFNKKTESLWATTPHLRVDTNNSVDSNLLSGKTKFVDSHPFDPSTPPVDTSTASSTSVDFKGKAKLVESDTFQAPFR